MSKVLVQIELTQEDVENLQKFMDAEHVSTIEEYKAYLSLEKIIKVILTEEDRIQRRERALQQDAKCRCGHPLDWHANTNTPVCCAEGCNCFEFNRKYPLNG